MSEMVTIHGDYKCVHTGNLTPELLNKYTGEYCGRTPSKHSYTTENGYIDWLYDDIAVYDFKDKRLYVLIKSYPTGGEEYTYIDRKADGIINIKTRFYNGGASFDEVFLEALHHLDTEK